MLTDQERKAAHAAVWRWHFYAGLYVAPFLVMLALTGLVMLFERTVERWQYPAMTRSGAAGRVSHQARLDAARSAVPGATLLLYQPGRAAGEPTRVGVDRAGEPGTIYVDEGTGRVLGFVPDRRRIDRIANRIHATLLLGDLGDRLIEIAAGLGVLLLASGLYLWIPRTRSLRGAFGIGPGSARVVWRGVHRLVGFLLAPALLFYLVSGLAWTGVWGGRLVQAWSTFPAAKRAPGADGGHQHVALNANSSKRVPWGLEQALLPSSSSGAHAGDLTLDEAIAIAQQNGIGPRFWAGVPEGRADVWTVAQTTMAGDIADPRDELTLHLDRRTGAILARVAWSDYGLGARAMAAGIPLHMGYLGWWNKLASAAVCVLVLLLAISGPVMWWLRRPARSLRLAAPPAPARVPGLAWVLLATLSLAFPLVALVLLLVGLADRIVIRRVPALRALLD
jgi:uncharacterized iron-regulated membrane protein